VRALFARTISECNPRDSAGRALAVRFHATSVVGRSPRPAARCGTDHVLRTDQMENANLGGASVSF
jgi:hypothetical protein